MIDILRGRILWDLVKVHIGCRAVSVSDDNGTIPCLNLCLMIYKAQTLEN